MIKKSILITNDDGIHAAGIQAMSRALVNRYGSDTNLAVIAPDHERSAIGHAITMHRPLRVEETFFLSNPELKGWVVNGTPADCVKLAVEVLLPHQPELIISGINRGSNLGTDVLYSGTVSAAVEGVILGIPSIAVSYTHRKDPDFSLAAEFICDLIPLLLENVLPPGVILNINVPPGNKHEVKGVVLTCLGDRRYQNPFEKRIDPRGNHYYWLAGEAVETKLDRSYDVGAIKEGYISITPIHLNLTCYDTIKSLQDIINRLAMFH